jgi:imidazole glycerol phosphate synthase subunit HisF
MTKGHKRIKLEEETNTGEETESDESRKWVKAQKKRGEGGILTTVRRRKGMMIGSKRDRKEMPDKEEE